MSSAPAQQVAGQVAISIGIKTELYEHLCSVDRQIQRVLVDVRKFMDAPPKEERVGINFPDPAVIAQVETHPRFAAAVAA